MLDLILLNGNKYRKKVNLRMEIFYFFYKSGLLAENLQKYGLELYRNMAYYEKFVETFEEFMEIYDSYDKIDNFIKSQKISYIKIGLIKHVHRTIQTLEEENRRLRDLETKFESKKNFLSRTLNGSDIIIKYVVSYFFFKIFDETEDVLDDYSLKTGHYEIDSVVIFLKTFVLKFEREGKDFNPIEFLNYFFKSKLFNNWIKNSQVLTKVKLIIYFLTEKEINKQILDKLDSFDKDELAYWLSER
jgi:hypothetical protein